jgi:hypothetical protein
MGSAGKRELHKKSHDNPVHLYQKLSYDLAKLDIYTTENRLHFISLI